MCLFVSGSSLSWCDVWGYIIHIILYTIIYYTIILLLLYLILLYIYYTILSFPFSSIPLPFPSLLSQSSPSLLFPYNPLSHLLFCSFPPLPLLYSFYTCRVLDMFIYIPLFLFSSDLSPSIPLLFLSSIPNHMIHLLLLYSSLPFPIPPSHSF